MVDLLRGMGELENPTQEDPQVSCQEEGPVIWLRTSRTA
jgi:hypothetical protein